MSTPQVDEQQLVKEQTEANPPNHGRIVERNERGVIVVDEANDLEVDADLCAVLV